MQEMVKFNEFAGGVTMGLYWQGFVQYFEQGP